MADRPDPVWSFNIRAKSAMLARHSSYVHEVNAKRLIVMYLNVEVPDTGYHCMFAAGVVVLAGKDVGLVPTVRCGAQGRIQKGARGRGS